MRKDGVAVVLESGKQKGHNLGSSSKGSLPQFLVVARIGLEQVMVLAVELPLLKSRSSVCTDCGTAHANGIEDESSSTDGRNKAWWADCAG